MDKHRIVVVGSFNTDMVVKVDRLPGPGETVCGGEFIMAAGGKGANQAVAAARLGAAAYFVGRVGEDVFGDRSIENLNGSGVDTSYVVRDKENPSGVALIFVDKRGENTIAVAPGSNGKLGLEDVDRAKVAIGGSDALVLQLEIPVDAVEHAIDIAVENKVSVILNPAPARTLESRIISKVNYLIPNEHEMEMLVGLRLDNLEDSEEAAKTLVGQGVEAVILTLGARGALVVTGEVAEHLVAPKVEAVDTTAAGDAFVGAFAVAMSGGMTLLEAVKFANCAAALSVTKLGAQPSLPTRAEVAKFMGSI